LEYYQQRWFQNVVNERAVGEKSSSYLFGGKVVADRIKPLIPNAKFIFSLRNPIERTWASYRFTVLNGLEPLDFETALEREKQRTAEQTGQWAEIQPYNYTGRGLYASQLESYLGVFPRERIHIIKFEDMKTDSKLCLHGLFKFLEVDPGFEPEIDEGRFSSLEVKDPALQKQLRDRFGERFSQIIKSVRHGTDPAVHVRSAEEHEYLKQFIENLNTGIREIKPETREYLQDVFHHDLERLKNIVDFSIEDWN